MTAPSHDGPGVPARSRRWWTVPFGGPYRRLAIALGIGAIAVGIFSATASSYLLFLFTGGLGSVVVMQSYGLITGRAGVISLCQLSFAAIGAWTVGWANVHNVPGGYYVWLPLGGLTAVVAGIVIGIPALRLRGVSLAVATFAFATSLDVVFGSINFPGQDQFNLVQRPDLFAADGDFFIFTAIVAAVIFVGLWFLDRSRLGGALVEIRHSERAAAAHGINVARGKLAAFALSAFVAGIAGGLMAGQLGVVSAQNFTSAVSVAFFAVALFVGTHNVEGAILGGLIGAMFPVLIDLIGIPQDLAAMFFGIAAIQVLSQGGSQTDMARAKRRRKRAKTGWDKPAERSHPADAAPATNTGPAATTGPTATTGPIATTGPATTTGPTTATGLAATAVPDASVARMSPVMIAAARPALEVRDLRVRFGNLVAVDGVNLRVPRGCAVGLVGPNGAGKSTLINSVTGFIPRYEGSVLLDGTPVDGLAAHRRARAGLRRSFQQLRVPTALNVGMFLQVAAGHRLSNAEIDEQLAWFDCPPADVPIEAVDVATRRLLEVAGLAAGRPPVLLLDEPAAGQSSGETRALALRLAEIPARCDTALLLVEHDIELVRSTCDLVVVLDFGRVIAEGPPDTVLSDPAVVAAYLGGEEIETRTKETS